jgi:predicted nuclease of predicted toxin-antitoxin system
MKLLFDNNLSHKLAQRLGDIFPGSSHVMTQQLDESTDQEIWSFARENDFTIVTKDSDFNEIRLLKGFPPKVIWLRIRNCRVSYIERVMRDKYIILKEFAHNESSGIIEIE